MSIDKLSQYEAQERASHNGRAESGFRALFGFPITNARRWSQNLRTAVEVEGPNGERIRWERQVDLAIPRLLVMPVISAGLHKKAAMPKPDEAIAIYEEIIGHCEQVEAEDASSEAESWIQAVLNHNDVVTDISAADAVEAWLAWKAMQTSPQLTRGDLATWIPPVLDDGTFEYVRLSDVAAYARQVERVTIDWEGLKARVAESGWSFHFVQLWQPDVPRGEAERAVVRTLRRRLEA